MTRKLLQLKFLLPMLPLQIGLYAVRLLWWHYTYYDERIRPPLVIVQVVASLIPLALLGLVVSVILVSAMVMSLSRTTSFIPSVFLIVGIFLLMLLPLPEPPLLPEAQHFLDHRTDYEQAVELVQRANTNNTSGNSCKSLPIDIRHLAHTGCVDVTNNELGLFVRFYPLDSPYPIVYIERDNKVDFCLYDFYIEEKIDSHWYVCYQDWN